MIIYVYIKRGINMAKSEKVKKPIYKKWWFYLVLILVVGAIGGALGDDEPTQKNDTPETSDKEEKPKEEPTVYRLNEAISYKDFDITLGNQREISGITGTVYTVFDVEIVSKKDNFSFFGNFQGVTDENEVVSDTIAFVSDDLGDPVTTAFTKKLDTNQKLKGYLAFDKSIAKLEVTSSSFSNKKITIDLD